MTTRCGVSAALFARMRGVDECLIVFQVREHAQVLVPQGVVDEGKKLPLPDTGLEGALFDMLDVETDPTLRSHVQV